MKLIWFLALSLAAFCFDHGSASLSYKVELNRNQFLEFKIKYNKVYENEVEEKFRMLIFIENQAKGNSDHIHADKLSHELETLSDNEMKFEAFKAEYNKIYKNEFEEKFRMNVFQENRDYIAQHNQKYAQGLVSFKLGVNKYSDMSNHEIITTMNGYNASLNANFEEGATFISPANVVTPKTVDWRTQGAVTPVKDQGHCGSSWAFATTGALEGQHFRKAGYLVSLSEQNLVDCSKSNRGCHGGYAEAAFKYIKHNNGIDTEISYPYKGINDSCHFDKSHVGATDKGYFHIPKGNEEKLAEAVANVGPVAVVIDASHPSFHHYAGGVYYEPKCNSHKLHHAVLVVGYGTDAKQGDYWLVKNSWGKSWGEQGFIKISRNKNNACGIASRASYPIV